MKTLYVKEIVGQINGEVVKGNGQYSIRNVVTHPIKLDNHTVLFDLNGKSYYYAKKLKCYPNTVIVTEEPKRYLYSGTKLTIVYVENIDKAFWEFIHFYRNLWDIPVIGVTGTCGKTTVKEMIVHILSGSFRIQSTYKSMNSLSYNLSYLLGIDDGIDVAVIEMGVAFPDDLIHSCNYFQPQIGIITKIGTDHLQHCKTQGNYILEKGKLLQGLKNKGTLIINADDENIKQIDMKSFQGKIIRFGVGTDADFRASEIGYTKEGMVFILHVKGKKIPAFVPGYGEHNVYNALASVAAASVLGVKLINAVESLKSFKHIERHLEFHKGLNGCIVIDDTWSSNPTSAEAALKVLNAVSHGKKTIAVFGRMELLGAHAQVQHALIGEKVVQYGIHTLITIDNMAKYIGSRAQELGMLEKSIISCISPDQFYVLMQELLDEQTVVLIKTSMLAHHQDFIRKILLKKEQGHE